MSEQDPKWEIGSQVFDLVTGQIADVHGRRSFHGVWVYEVVSGDIGAPRSIVERFQGLLAAPNDKTASAEVEEVSVDLPGFPGLASVSQDESGGFTCCYDFIGDRGTYTAHGAGRSPEDAVSGALRIASDLKRDYGR